MIRRPGAKAPVEAPTAKAAPAPTTRRSRIVHVASSTELRQFMVSFVAEQVLEAETALEVLQQAQARGATEVTSIVRIA